MPEDVKVEQAEDVKVEKPEDVKVEPEEGKSYSQSDINAISAKTKDRTMSKILKELGVKDLSSATELIKKQKEYEEANATEVDKLKKELEELRAEQAETKSKLSAKEQAEVAISLGVSPKLASKAVKLASDYDGETFEEKLEAMIEDFGKDTFGIGKKLDNFGAKPTGGDSKPSAEEIRKAIRGEI